MHIYFQLALVWLVLAASSKEGSQQSRYAMRLSKPLRHAGAACALTFLCSMSPPAMAATDSPFTKQVERLEKAREELLSLDKEWVQVVTARGGDGIRSRIGTVYKPPLCEPALCNRSCG